MEHLTKYNVISHTQYAFRPNSNCTLALQTILNSIHKHKKRSVRDWGNSIWGTDDPNATRLQLLITTQNNLIRLIKNLPPRTHTRPLMAELKILSVPSLYISLRRNARVYTPASSREPPRPQPPLCAHRSRPQAPNPSNPNSPN